MLLALLRPDARAELLADEAAFLTVAFSTAVSAWVALLLAEMGRFSLTTAALLLLAGSGLVLVLLRGRAAIPWHGVRADRRAAAATAAVLALAFLLQARPGEYLLGGRDPGIYVAAMATIARTGGIAYVDPVVLSIPKEDVELFYRHATEKAPYSWGRFMGFPLESPRTGRVVPEFFHLFPAFGAYLFQAMGVRGALATAPLFGILGTLAVFMALRRILGPPAGLLASLLLSVCVVQVWFARYPVSEPMSQMLVFSSFFTIALWEARATRGFGLVAGVLVGIALLVRIDSPLLAAALVLYLAHRRARHELFWRDVFALLTPVALLACHALVHAAFWSRKYLVDVVSRPYWQQPGWVWLAGTVVVLAVILAAHRVGPRVIGTLDRHQGTLRAGLTAALLVLALYAYFLRPLLSLWARADGNDPALALADPGWLRDRGFHLLAAHDAQSLVRLGWFVTPVVLVLAGLGLVAALREWRRAYLFPGLAFLAYALFYLYKIRVYSDYYFALRRFVPVVVPILFALAALFLVRLGARGGVRRAAAGALFAGCAAWLLAGTWPILRHREWSGAVRFVDDVARRFTPHDVVIFEQPRSIHLLSLPLWAVHGVNAVELARWNPDPARLQHLVRTWRTRYRNIYFVHTYSTDLCGLFLQRVEEQSFGAFEWERAYGRPPQRAEFKSLRFTISRVVLPEELQVPALPELDVGGSDDVQVSGFYDKEGAFDHTYRWTGSCATVYMPAAREAAAVVVTASAGRRPAEPPVEVRVTLGETPLGSFTASGDWQDHRLEVPPAARGQAGLLRLDVRGWRPANEGPGSDDVRDLGIMVDRVRVLLE